MDALVWAMTKLSDHEDQAARTRAMLGDPSGTGRARARVFVG
jgi:hypothetical protein